MITREPVYHAIISQSDPANLYISNPAGFIPGSVIRIAKDHPLVDGVCDAHSAREFGQSESIIGRDGVHKVF